MTGRPITPSGGHLDVPPALAALYADGLVAVVRFHDQARPHPLPEHLRAQLLGHAAEWRAAAQSGTERRVLDGVAVHLSDAPQLLTYQEVRHVYGIPERTLRDLADAGEIPVVQLGRSVRFHRPDLDAYIANRKTHRRTA